MSTTFDVLPSIKVMPTFEQLLNLSNQKLNEYLKKISILKEINIKVLLHNKNETAIYKPSLYCITKWSEEDYAWFYIDGISGGTDCYFRYNSQMYSEIWNDAIKENDCARFYKSEIYKNLDIGYHWTFRRSAGQSGIISLIYGLIAASLSKLTNGLIYTDDGAWDYTRFPTTAEEFCNWYMNPDLTDNINDKSFAEQCIRSISEEIQLFKGA